MDRKKYFFSRRSEVAAFTDIKISFILIKKYVKNQLGTRSTLLSKKSKECGPRKDFWEISFK